MTGKRQEEILKRFMDRYSLGASSALNDVEKEAIGAVVGANGYTTVAQADQLIEVLGLEAGTWLLDIGAARYGALVRALSRKPSKSSGRMRHSRPNFSAGSLPR